jgi:(4S)-4-hydroxy-5-phosphonooxypentane-2,3-dione isomerase
MIVLRVDMLVKPGAESQCLEIIRKLQENTRKEPGCVYYAGQQSKENPRRFFMYEVYKDEAALQAHRDAPYFKQYVHGGFDAIVEQRTRELFDPVE